VLLSIASYVFLSIFDCVFFVVHHGKGICPAFFRMCNGCVVHSTIGFHVGGPLSTFGLFVVGFGNVG
jgi:hypothetical protein